ncbi:hypothetical protein D9M68_294770 [compost metagenome]
MPTTTPVAVEVSAAGTDSLVSGPTIMQIMLKLKKVVTNSSANSFAGSAPVRIIRNSATAVARHESSATGLRPRRSDRVGMTIIPQKPPKPIADMTKPICCMPMCR